MKYKTGKTFRDYSGCVFIKTVNSGVLIATIQDRETDELYQKEFHLSKLEDSPSMTMGSFCNCLKKVIIEN